MWLFDYVQKKKKAAYLTAHGMDSACPHCGQWESDGITITNTDLEDTSTMRKCSACDHEWQTVFTPFGFVPVNGEKSVEVTS